MKITIEHKAEQREYKPKGLFAFSKSSTFEDYYTVYLRVELSAEERAKLSKHRLWDTEIGTKQNLLTAQDIPDEALRADLNTPFPVTIKNYFSADGYFHSFSTLIESRNYERELKTNILPKIKQLMDMSGEWKDGPQTFEL